jgi:thiol-disulfide isomerase/thioredoxin
MKISICIVLMLAILCLTKTSSAQSNKEQARYLHVGDKAPELNPLKWIKGQPTSTFKNGQIYVVAFGATWCAPCAAAIPDLTAIAKNYQSNVTVMEIFVMEEQHRDPPNTKMPSYVLKVEKYVEKKGDKMQYMVAVDDAAGTIEKAWIEGAGKVGVPHIFIVDRNGLIAWMGSNPKAAEKVIIEMQKSNYAISSMVKRDSLINSFQEEYNPLQLMNKESLDRLLYFSHLSIYKSGQVGLPNYPFIENFRWAQDPDLKDRQGKIQVLGENLRRLYYMAYGDTLWNSPPQMYPPYSGIYPDTVKYPHQRRSYGNYWYRPILEVKDSSLFEANYTSPTNRFNYIVKVPFEKATSGFLQKIMQHDLKVCFGYEVLVIEKMMPCWELMVPEKNRKKLITKTPGNPYKRTVNSDGITKITNAQVRDIIFQLENRFGNSSLGNLIPHPGKQPPFIDATGIIGDIDYSYNEAFYTKLLEDKNIRDTFSDYKKWLEEIGFELKRSQRKMRVVVVRDPKS